MRVHNERSGVEFDAWFEDYKGTPVVPPSVHYRLRCTTNDQTVIDWTLANAETETDESGITGIRATILIPGSANRLLDAANRREVRELQVVAGKDTDREYSVSHEYYIVNMGR